MGRWPRVDRRTVFGIARRTDTAQGRRHLLVAALVWGTGTKAQLVDRRARIFVHSSTGDIDTRLATALDVLQERGASAAYFAFNNNQQIPHLGPAFFTKVLYFAGHDRTTTPHRPVILDSVVSRALKATKMVAESWRWNGWSTEQYGQYLAIVHAHAKKAGVLPDQVEAALFSCGKRLP